MLQRLTFCPVQKLRLVVQKLRINVQKLGFVFENEHVSMEATKARFCENEPENENVSLCDFHTLVNYSLFHGSKSSTVFPATPKPFNTSHFDSTFLLYQ